MLTCKAADPDDTIQARGVTSDVEAADLPTWIPTWIMYMPGGVHAITAKSRGKPVEVRVQVDETTAATLQKALSEMLQAGDAHRPYFDFDHEDREASAWPLEFAWLELPSPGVYAKINWSESGRVAVTGKSFRAFSPAFHIDKSDPAVVTGAPLNMGGLVNRPAFRAIQPLWAKEPSSSQKTKNNDSGMNEQELAELKAKLSELEKQNTELQAKLASSDHTDAIKAKDTEIAAKKAEMDGIKAKLAAAENLISLQRKRDAKAAVDAAVARGAIPPKDEALQAKWIVLIEDNPDNSELLAKLPGRELKPLQSGGKVELVTEDIVGVLKAYSAERNPLARGSIFAKEVNGRLDKGEILPFGRVPIEAGNTLGTLVGNIISQRTLALVFSLRPPLKNVITDFSDEQARLSQAVYTRTVGLPTVQNFGGTVSETADADYAVTLSNHKEVRWTFTAAEVQGTARNLVKEHAEALAAGLGIAFADAVAALITDAFTSETVVASASVDYSTITGVVKTLNNAGCPPGSRFGWVNEDVAEALKNDELVMSNFDRNNSSAYGHWMGVHGFADIWEYPALPANSVNLTAFFGHANTLLLATRVPVNPETLVAAGYPGTMEVVTDPISGLSVVRNDWIAQDTLAINNRLITLYGCARGNVAVGHKLVSS